jgi:hypothetical protein
VAGRRIVGQAGEQQRNLRRFDHFNFRNATGGDRLGVALRDLVACFHDDLARAIAAGRVAHVIDGNLAFDLRNTATIDDLLRRGFVEDADDVRVGAVFWAHGPQ